MRAASRTSGSSAGCVAVPTDLGLAEVVVLGPAPPLRGGIAAHTARVIEHLLARGVTAQALSYRRLYPQMLFPGRTQRTDAAAPAWCHEVLDVLGPATWRDVRRQLQHSSCRVVLQWWHPVVAPALLWATSGIARERLVAVCHNVLPHDRVWGAELVARRVLGRCGRVVCHSDSEFEVLSRVVGARGPKLCQVPLPSLIPPGNRSAARPAELVALPAGARIFLAAGHQRAYKGTAGLLRAWQRSRRPPEARLVVVGESYLRGSALREVARLAAADPSIVIVDRYVEDAELVSFLASSEALLAAHLAASQSGVIPIARALGLACVVSDAGGLAEQAGLTGSDGRGEVARDGSGGDGDVRSANREANGEEVDPRGEVVSAGDEGRLAQALERRFSAFTRTPEQRGVLGPNDSYVENWAAVVEAMGIRGRP